MEAWIQEPVLKQHPTAVVQIQEEQIQEIILDPTVAFVHEII